MLAFGKRLRLAAEARLPRCPAVLAVRLTVPGAQTEGRKTLGEAMAQIIPADLTLSLDSVLAVAGAIARRPTHGGSNRS